MNPNEQLKRKAVRIIEDSLCDQGATDRSHVANKFLQALIEARNGGILDSLRKVQEATTGMACDGHAPDMEKRILFLLLPHIDFVLQRGLRTCLRHAVTNCDDCREWDLC